MIQKTPYSRLVHKMARHILKSEGDKISDIFTHLFGLFKTKAVPMHRGWAFYVPTNMSYNKELGPDFAYNKGRKGIYSIYQS